MTNHPNRSSKTAAIRAAQKHVSAPIGSRTSWTVVGPYRSTEPSGPSTDAHFDSYAKAVNARSTWVAKIAVTLMGKPDLATTVDYIAYSRGQQPVVDLVSAALVEGPMDA